MKRRFSRKNVAGVIFSSKGAYRGLEAWVEAKAPNDSLVYDTPANLLRAGFKIVDGHKVDGMYFRGKSKVPEVTEVTLPRNVNKLVDPRSIPAKVFPGLIFFDADNPKHKPRNIGTTGPSKVTREAKAKAAAEETKTKKAKSK